MESILKDLESLPASKLVEVAHYVSRFNPKRRNERLAALQSVAGCMSGEEGAAFEKAVREEALPLPTSFGRLFSAEGATPYQPGGSEA